MKSRTDKQDRILRFLRTFVAEHDYPPSIRDIQTGCGISSTSVVDYNLKALESKGVIRRDREISRGIVLVDEDARRGREAAVPVPLLGVIAAGQPLPLPAPEGQGEAEAREHVAVPRDMVGKRQKVFALKVRGTSMIDALINDGDIVLLEPCSSVRDGEMAAVFLREENEVTLKKFYRDGERVRLQPMNAAMRPLYTPARNAEVQGRVVGSMRSF